jgi:amino acid adenylation domain-containing protein
MSDKKYQVLGNGEGRLSVWPAGKAVPPGWTPVGVAGAREECLAEIDARGEDDSLLAASAAPGPTLVDLFAGAVDEHGDRPAVSDDTETLSYREVDERSELLCAQLAAMGVRRGDRVVVHRERGVETLVGIIAILKAGAAYVNVDTRYPRSRRDRMVRDCQARLVLTQPGWEDEVERPPGCGVLTWTSRTAEVPVGDLTEEVRGPRACDVASVLFTSGSSGAPKVIMLEHRNLRYFATNPGLPALRPGDRVGQVSSISFDAFHFECWCAVAAGAEIVVLPPMAELVARDLGRELRQRRITAMLAPTMVVNSVVHEDRDAFSPLRLLLSGGDVLQPAACRTVLSGSFDGELYNLYGPAEGTTACTRHLVAEVAPDADTVPIGTELAGARVYLLDAELEEVAPGTVGEIHIGGLGVARGYFDQPALTAQRFLPDPFSGAGERMYATGDLARRGEDGVLEFLGRADDQVKIRGYRVEPGEVERVLGRHPEVRDVVVTATGPVDDRRLVALVVPYDNLPPRELRSFAESELPDYMVPRSIIMTDQIPANEHGKRATGDIAALVDEHLRRARARVEPKDDIERYLAALWESLLSVESVGSTDEFLALGGNSLVAFRIQRRVKRDQGVVLHAREVLGIDELGKIADLIRARRGAGT